MACRLFGAKPLPKSKLSYCQLDPWEQTSVKFESKCKTFHSRKCIWKCRLRNGGHFVRGWGWIKLVLILHFFQIGVVVYMNWTFWKGIHSSFTLVACWFLLCVCDGIRVTSHIAGNVDKLAVSDHINGLSLSTVSLVTFLDVYVRIKDARRCHEIK